MKVEVNTHEPTLEELLGNDWFDLFWFALDVLNEQPERISI